MPNADHLNRARLVKQLLRCVQWLQQETTMCLFHLIQIILELLAKA